MIPDRVQIATKIEEIQQDPTFSTIWSDLVERMEDWLQEIGCPNQAIIAGQTVNPKEQIIDDLKSYL